MELQFDGQEDDEDNGMQLVQRLMGRKPNAEAHGRRSRTVQPLVGSLDGDK